jgi:hypothetical protein
MRFIQGETLQEAIEKLHERDQSGRSMSERNLLRRQILHRFLVVCNTIAYAHSRGILHRDLKPQNVLLSKYGETIVVDWGMAKTFRRSDEARVAGESTLTPASGSDDQTRPGQLAGTPGFMSPEQAAGSLDGLGPATDIYSLGVILYIILCGQRPFSESNIAHLLDRVQRGEFHPPSYWKADVPCPLEAICLKAMSLRPEDRYTTALDLATDVEHWLADEPVQARRESLFARLARWMRRHQRTITVISFLLISVIAAQAAGITWLEQAREETKRELEKEVASKRAIVESQGLTFNILDRLWAAAVSSEGIGDANVQLGKEGEARRAYLDALENRQKAAELNFGTLRFQAELITILLKLGRFEEKHGQHLDAIGYYREAFRVLSKLEENENFAKSPYFDRLKREVETAIR